jgi:hypothetical protein
VPHFSLLLREVGIAAWNHSSVGAGFHLHPQEASDPFDADVVAQGVSPRFEYVIAVQRGLRHELEFDPFAPLLETWETLPMLHLPRPEIVPKTQKARPVAAPF